MQKCTTNITDPGQCPAGNNVTLSDIDYNKKELNNTIK